jgi:hypothetical protein
MDRLDAIASGTLTSVVGTGATTDKNNSMDGNGSGGPRGGLNPEDIQTIFSNLSNLVIEISGLKDRIEVSGGQRFESYLQHTGYIQLFLLFSYRDSERECVTLR